VTRPTPAQALPPGSQQPLVLPPSTNPASTSSTSSSCSPDPSLPFPHSSSLAFRPTSLVSRNVSIASVQRSSAKRSAIRNQSRPRFVCTLTSFQSTFCCRRHAVHTLNRCSRVWVTAQERVAAWNYVAARALSPIRNRKQDIVGIYLCNSRVVKLSSCQSAQPTSRHNPAWRSSTIQHQYIPQRENAESRRVLESFNDISTGKAEGENYPAGLFKLLPSATPFLRHLKGRPTSGGENRSLVEKEVSTMWGKELGIEMSEM